MLLLIDAGNSLIKWALAPADMSAGTGPASWLHTGETPHHETDTLYDLWQQVKPERAVSRVLISNVAGITAKERLTDLIRKLQPEPDNIAWFASAPVLAGVKNSYDDFSQLGSDRFASLVGACSLFPNENLVVVTCGTATTIDTLSSDGVFIGG
ncbi:MAG: type III pantothenate kinase, partial [Oxalobacter sp.]|nr:type III pantothenate kinase [Oxalobacter sp.]